MEAVKNLITVSWEKTEGADEYALFWSDCDSPAMEYEKIYYGSENEYAYAVSAHRPYYFYAEAYRGGSLLERSEKILSTAVCRLEPQLEKLSRGLIAVNTGEGIFTAWRMFRDEVKGAEKERLTGTDYRLFRNGEEIALVSDSTKYFDKDGKE